MRIKVDAEPIEEFDIDIYFRVIEKMTIYQGNKDYCNFLDGTDIEVIID